MAEPAAFLKFVPEGGMTPPRLDPADGIPKVGLVVRWDAATSAWVDDQGEAGASR
jgi:hypothetical protein